MNSNQELHTTLILGDCLEELKKLESKSVSLIVTSPPYADQRTSTYGGIKPDKYVEWFMPIAVELKRVLKDDGTFILNICLLYTSDAADERSSVDLGGRRIIKKKKHSGLHMCSTQQQHTIIH